MSENKKKHMSSAVNDFEKKHHESKQNQNKTSIQEANGLNFSKIKDKLASHKQQYTSRSPKMSPESVEKVLKDVQAKFGYENREEAAGAIGILCQLGGVAKNCNGDNTYTEVFGKKLTLNQLRTILKRNKEQGNIRKLARSLSEYIHLVCLESNIPGNLSKRIQENNSEMEFTISEKVFMSDFQLENPNLPPRIRKLITESRNYTKNNKTKQKKKKQ